MSAVGEAGSSSVQRLDEAAKEHEKDIVIDLGADRFIKWIGVYLFLALALLLKVAEAIEDNIVCFPANSSTTVDDKVISYATSYCWETNSLQNLSSSCAIFAPMLENPRLLKEFIQWFPYALLFQSFAFAMPWAYWHFRFGARTLGHLKFMQLLLDSIFDNLRGIEDKLFYKGKPYDEKSRQFDGYRPYNKNNQQNSEKKIGFFTALFNSFRSTFCSETEETEDTALNTVGVANESANVEREPLKKQNAEKTNAASGNGSGGPSTSKAKSKTQLKLSFCEKLIVGKMRDRHLFSILCYENFAHLPHLPYILSVFKLAESSSEQTAPKRGYYYLDQAMLYLWSDDKNLQNILLIKKYLLKHIFTALLALTMLGLMIALAVLLYDDVITEETFPCQLTYDNICVFCSFRGKRDLYALFTIDLVLTFFIFFGSLWHWLSVRNSSELSNSHYFDELKSTSNIALQQVYKAKKQKKDQ